MKNILLIGVSLAFICQLALANSNRVSVEITKDGFKPSSVKLKPGAEAFITLTRTTDAT